MTEELNLPPDRPVERRRLVLEYFRSAFQISVTIGIAITLVLIVLLGVSQTKNTNILIDCTTPKHACYERGQTQAGTFIQSLDDTIILAAVCGTKLPQPLQVEAMQTCITTEYHKLHK